MGRPPSNGAPAFRFNHPEVAQMETILREHEGQIPARELLVALAEKFSNSPERAGKVTVQMKQVWNWFQNRRYALRSKLVKSPGKLNVSPLPREEVAPVRNVSHVPQQIPVSSGHNVVRSMSETSQMEFEAKSARDGAWYDVQAFLSHRYLETGNPEVLVRFAGFGPEEDEWINVRKHVRQRSLPCESSECVAVLPGDLILCFQEGKEQALYFDAHVLDAQRRRHDIRGCRCRFLVRYDHDQSEEIVPLRKICRRPETDHRLQVLHAANESAAAAAAAAASASASVSLDLQTQQKPAVVVADPSSSSSATLRVTDPNPTSTTNAVAPFPPPNNNISPALGPTAPSPFPSVGPTATPTPAPSPAPAPVPFPVSAPVPVSAPPVAVPVPVPVPPVPVPVSVPESNKVERDTPRVSTGEATSQETITCPSEARNVESINLESNPPLGQVESRSPKAIITMPTGPEKSEGGSNSGHLELQGTCATLPTEDIKE